MKRCPECRRDYYDDTLLYCLDDGNALLEGPATVTYVPPAGEEPTRRLIPSDWERMIRAETHPADREFDRRYENLAPLIGRREELAAIKELLTGASERLVTLTGIGGTGKTRLSIEVARDVKSNFPDGVFFVELSRITDADLVIPTIAHSIGIESRHRDVVDSLGRYLRERSVLLVVDNMEQVVSAGVQLAELVRQSSNVKILVTSRAPLGLSLETEYRLSPLALPNQQPGLSISELMDCESVQLFVARARQAWREFELTEDNAEVVAAICRKLDGLPLALELAAARAKVLSPSEILERLENSLALLTGGSQDLPGRQQTIRAAVEWSYDLLDAVEQAAFWRLSVFEGSFTLDQAEKVIADSKIVEAEILDVVTSLSEKSLLASVRTGQPEIRFRMLQLVRDFALEILTREDGDGSIRGAHASYFLELAQQASEHLETSDSAEWLARLESNHDNLRAAIRWSLSDDIETAARLMAALRNFLIIRGHIRQGRQWFEEVLTKETGLSSDLRWELLTGLGNMSQFQGDYPRAREAYANSLDEALAANDQKKIARSLRGLGAVDYIQRDFPSARERIVEALDISRSLDDDFGIAASLSRLGDIAVAEGNMEEGRLPIIESLGLFRKLGNKMGIMAKLNNLATAELLLGNTENSRTRLVESLSISRELGDRMNSRTALEGWAAIMFASGEFRKSALFCGAGAALGEMMGIELEPVEQRLLDFYFDPLREEMGESHFSEVFAEGRKMTADAAIGLALKFEDNPE